MEEVRSSETSDLTYFSSGSNNQGSNKWKLNKTRDLTKNYKCKGSILCTSSTKESISTGSKENKNQQDMNKTIGSLMEQNLWAANKDIEKRLAAFEWNVLKLMFFFGGGVFKVKKNWRKRYNKEIMQMVEDLDILWFVSISRLNWIGHVSRMDGKR